MFTVAFLVFTVIIGLLERFAGLPPVMIGWAFILLTLGLYATIGILSRTKALDEYYVAGRRVPGFFNGMATGADWMSAASFISMAGTLFVLGYDGLAYIMGWTGGYVLLALLLAPYIRKFGQFTIPDFVGARFEGNRARVVASIAAIIVSFTYVTAQVTGVGIIMSRFVGVPYQYAVFIGLAGVLVCSFLGGMKAVTWTQVAQYIILIVAYLIPVTMLAVRFTGVALPQLMYGEALQNIIRLEAEQGITKQYVLPFNEVLSRGEVLVNQWVGTPWQFLALMACLMLGTAGLPHILIRFYTVPSVKESRTSVGWALFFIFLLYFTAPAYAAFARWEILQNIVGSNIAQLPAWAANWTKTGLLAITDANADGILQFSELRINGDLIVLATPEIAGLPYTVAALVAAGGLAAALSTADGLLVVIASAVAHDIFFRTLRPNATMETRIFLGKAMVLVAAAVAALAALPRLALIAQMVAWAFSLAAASFFPVLIMGIFWRRANGPGAIAGMIGGLAVTIIYGILNYNNPAFNILGITHVAAGIFGLPVNFALIYVVSKLTPEPAKEIQDLVDDLRNPFTPDDTLPALAPAPAPKPVPAD